MRPEGIFVKVISIQRDSVELTAWWEDEFGNKLDYFEHLRSRSRQLQAGDVLFLPTKIKVTTE